MALENKFGIGNAGRRKVDFASAGFRAPGEYRHAGAGIAQQKAARDIRADIFQLTRRDLVERAVGLDFRNCGSQPAPEPRIAASPRGALRRRLDQMVWANL